MSPRRTRRGTVRENISEISNDTSFKASKALRSNRRMNKSQNVKGSEEDSDNPAELNSSLDNVNSVNDASSNVRKRTKVKIQEALMSQDSSLSVTADDSKIKSKTRKKNIKTPKSTGKSKSNKSQIIDATSHISEDEPSFTSDQKDDRQLAYINNLINEDDEILEAVSKKKFKSDSKSTNLLKTPERSEKSMSQDKTPETDITPKSSPLNVSFTPHRSTKTPKKSPINLGSPKTHSEDPEESFKLLNVQRKLSIVDSPSSSDKSNDLSQQSNSFNVVNSSIENTKKSSKSIKSVLKSSSKKKSISPLLKIRPKFSKSPKIVFRTPKSKSSKSKKSSSNKKLSVSPTKSKKSSNTLLKSGKTTPANSSVTSKNKEINDSPVKSEKFSTTIIKPEEYSKFENSSFVLLSALSPETDLALKAKLANNKVASPSISEKLPENDAEVKSSKSLNSTSKKSKKSKKSSPEKSKSPISLLSKSKKSFTPLISKKMPKIILGKKRSKSVSPLKKARNISPSKSKKSPKVSSSKSKKTPNDSSLKSKKSLKNSSSKSKKSVAVSPQTSDRMSVKLSTKKSITSSSSSKLPKNSSISPRVILKKLSSPLLSNSSLSAKENLPTINLIPVDHIQLSANSKYTLATLDHKSTKSNEKKKSVTSTKSNKSKTSTSKSSVNSDSNKNVPFDFLEKKLINSKPANTSTPREKAKRAFNLDSNIKNKSSKRSSSSVLLNGSSTPKPKALKRLNNQSNVKAQQSLLEDESEPSLDDSSLIHMSDVFDSDNSQKDNTFEINKTNLDKRKSLQDLNVSQKSTKINNTFETNKSVTKVKSIKDDTYEIENTSVELETKSNKRTLNNHEIGASDELEIKKNCRVHFANSSLDNQNHFNTINRVDTPGHAVQQKKAISVNKAKTPTNQFINKLENRRVSSVSSLQVKTPANDMNKRRSNSLSDSIPRSRKSNHEAQVASVNRLSRPKPISVSDKKLGVKTPVSKKIPNFAEIHKKNFEKMESLIDLKKRVEKRHVNLNIGTSSTKKINATKQQDGISKPAATDSTNGVYNKFGFKLRKNDAVNMISHKQAGNIESREKKREDARNVLKGVRMNRRFELQMKSRIKTT